MNFFKTLAMVGLVGVGVLTAAEPVVLEHQNEIDGVTVQLSPKDQTVKVGAPLRLNLLYSFKKGGHFMNPFGLSNNHPFPSGEIRVFKEDGAFQDIFLQPVFSGCFPDNEYPMYCDSLLGCTITVRPDTTKLRLEPGVYRLQLAVYDKLWLDVWKQKKTSSKAVLFSNVVICKVEKK